MSSEFWFFTEIYPPPILVAWRQGKVKVAESEDTRKEYWELELDNDEILNNYDVPLQCKPNAGSFGYLKLY